MSQKTSHRIRLANDNDLASCIDLSRASWPSWWSRNAALGKKHVRDCIQQQRCLVVTINNEIIAFLVWGTLWNKIHLQDIFVKDKYRKSGYGTKLIKLAVKMSREKGFKEVISDTDISNKRSIAFHLRNGFKKSGYIRKNWDNEDSVVFSKKIR